MEHSKWESNKDGGGVFVTMADSTPIYVAEALGATKEVRVERAAFIVTACNAHDDLLAACKMLADALIHVEGDTKGNKVRTAIIPLLKGAANIGRQAIAKAEGVN